MNDGLTLPPKTRIAIPSMAIQHDDDNFSAPMAFSGFRFARADLVADAEIATPARDLKSYEKDSAWSATSISPTNLA